MGTIVNVNIDDCHDKGIQMVEDGKTLLPGSGGVMYLNMISSTVKNSGDDNVFLDSNNSGQVYVNVIGSTLIDATNDGLHLEPQIWGWDAVNVMISGSTIKDNGDEGIQLHTSTAAFNDTVDIKDDVPIGNYQGNGDNDLKLEGAWENRLGYAAPGGL